MPRTDWGVKTSLQLLLIQQAVAAVVSRRYNKFMLLESTPSTGRMRIFISLNPPPVAAAALAQIQNRLRADLERLPHSSPAARWTRADQFHLTLQFLGETTPENLLAASQCLAALAASTALPAITMKGLGCFPAFKQPRVIWLGVEENPALFRIQEQLQESLAQHCGARRDEHFYPHLTLARIPRATGTVDDRFRLATVLESIPVTPLTWQPRAFSLMESRTIPGGTAHRCVAEIRALRAPAAECRC